MNTFHLEIVTPKRVHDEGQVAYARCPGLDGKFGIMANHAAAFIALGVGEIKITRDNKDYILATSGGYADIRENRVQLLVETAETPAEIDAGRAKAAAERAQQRLHQGVEIDQDRAQAALARALNRLSIVGK